MIKSKVTVQGIVEWLEEQIEQGYLELATTEDMVGANNVRIALLALMQTKHAIICGNAQCDHIQSLLKPIVVKRDSSAVLH